MARVLPVSRPAALLRRQQRAPRWLDHPFDHPCGMGHPQRRHRRKRMQNVAHGAETDHEQAKLGLGLQILIFSQGHWRGAWRVSPSSRASCRAAFRLSICRREVAQSEEGPIWHRRQELPSRTAVFLGRDQCTRLRRIAAACSRVARRRARYSGGDREGDCGRDSGRRQLRGLQRTAPGGRCRRRRRPGRRSAEFPSGGAVARRAVPSPVPQLGFEFGIVWRDRDDAGPLGCMQRLAQIARQAAGVVPVGAIHAAECRCRDESWRCWKPSSRMWTCGRVPDRVDSQSPRPAGRHRSAERRHRPARQLSRAINSGSSPNCSAVPSGWTRAGSRLARP